MHLKHHVSLVHINFHTILPRLQSLLSAQPTALQSIAHHFGAAKDLSKTLSRIGLERHPSVLELQHRWKHPQRSKTESLLKSNGVLPVIFHVDGATLFQDLSSFASMVAHGTALLMETDNDAELQEMEEEVEQPQASAPAKPTLWPTSRDLPLQDILFCKYACIFAVQTMKDASRDLVFSFGPGLSCRADQVQGK